MAQTTTKKKKLTDAKMALLRERKSNGFAYLAGKQRHNFTNYLMIYSKMAFSKTYFTKNDETHKKTHNDERRKCATLKRRGSLKDCDSQTTPNYY
jgi:hypothetical protein